MHNIFIRMEREKQMGLSVRHKLGKKFKGRVFLFLSVSDCLSTYSICALQVSGQLCLGCKIHEFLDLMLVKFTCCLLLFTSLIFATNSDAYCHSSYCSASLGPTYTFGLTMYAYVYMCTCLCSLVNVEILIFPNFIPLSFLSGSWTENLRSASYLRMIQGELLLLTTVQ